MHIDWLADFVLTVGMLALQDNPAAPAAETPFPSFWFLVIPILLAWMLFIMPDRRKQAEAKRMEGLKKNDRVVTVGGIHGVVVQAAPESKEVVIRVDEGNGTRLRVNRTAIASIVGTEDTPEKPS